jgi:hypothetical protein
MRSKRAAIWGIWKFFKGTVESDATPVQEMPNGRKGVTLRTLMLFSDQGNQKTAQIF